MNIYEQMLQDAGIPFSKEGIEAEWQRLNAAESVAISNDSRWSPFWRLITAIATTPALWLVRLLVETALPNLFLKHATGAWLRLHAWAVMVTPKDAVKTKGRLLFTREPDADGDIRIPAGTLVTTDSLQERYRVKTTTAATLTAEIKSALVPVEAEHAGSAWNLGPGYYCQTLEPLGVSVVNEGNWILIAGADPESDTALRKRCQLQFSAVGQYHHDAAYRADICSFAGVDPDYVWFAHDAPRGPGSADAYIMIDSGSPSPAFVHRINKFIRDQGHHGHGDDMRCYPMPVRAKTLAVTLYHSSHLSADKVTALQAAAKHRIRCAFRENQDFTGITRTLPFARFSWSRLAQELHRDLPDLSSVDFSLPDIACGMWIPALSQLTIRTEAI